MQELRNAMRHSKAISALAARAVTALPKGSPANTVAAAHVVKPVDYMRFPEFEAVLQRIRLRGGDRVLDVGSPQWFSLALASQYPAVDFLYVNIVEDELTPFRDIARALGLTNIRHQMADARKLPFSEHSFDKAVSISVLEHIYPESDGDIVALREIRRVLIASGELAITLPFKDRRGVVYVDGPVYERTGPSRKFFAREYDHEMLDASASDGGFSITDRCFISERPGLLAVDHWTWGPGRGRVAGRLLLKVRSAVERVAGVSLDAWLAQHHLRLSETPDHRLVNVAAVLRPSV